MVVDVLEMGPHHGVHAGLELCIQLRLVENSRSSSPSLPGYPLNTNEHPLTTLTLLPADLDVSPLA